MDILKQQIADMKNVAELFQLYYQKLEYTTFSGSHPYETELIVKNLKFVNKITINKNISASLTSLTSLASVSTSETPENNDLEAPHDIAVVKEFLDDAFKQYNTLKEGYLKLREIYEIYMNYDIEPYTTFSSSSMSSSSGSYIKGLLETFESIVNTWDYFTKKAESQVIEQLFIEKIMAIIRNVDILKVLEHIKHIYDKTNKLAMIDLYSSILKQINTTEHPVMHSSAGVGPQKYIASLVEELKNEILPLQPRNITNRKTTLQMLIQRYRLIPDGPSRDLSVLIGDLCNIKIDNKNHLQNLKKVTALISKKRKYGFIVFAKITPNPIENNIWLLTDTMYLQKNKLLLPTSAGLNNTILRKSQTIAPLYSNTVKDAHEKQHESQNGPNGSPKTSQKKDVLKDGIYYTQEDAEYYYILETLDGSTFRILYPWYISIFAKEKIYEIPANLLIDFTDPKASPYPKVETYNELLNGEILKHLKKPLLKTELLSSLEKKQIQGKWSLVRRKIARNMLEDYRDLFDNHTLTKDNILGLILHPDIFTNALNYIIESLGIRQDANIEVYMSALGSLNDLRRNMRRDVEKIYKDTYQAKILKLLESSSTIAASIKVVDALEDVLMEMLETQISEKSNVFALIYQKSLLLENIIYAATDEEL